MIASGQSATFTVVASGAGPFTYVWRFNGAVISSATTASLSASSPGQYQVEVSNGAGTTPSRIATLTVSSTETVAITAPGDGASVSDSVMVRVSASGATKVEFYLDGVRQFTDTSAPFAWTWNTALSANGAHALTAKAYNGTTLLATSDAVNVTVNNAAPPPCPDPNEPNDSSLTATPLAFSRDANGLFHVQWQGSAGQTYRLDASTNLVDWVPLLTTNAPGGLLDFTDPASATLPRRFYRVSAALVDPGGFRTNGLAGGGQVAFKLCMAGEQGRGYQVVVG